MVSGTDVLGERTKKQNKKITFLDFSYHLFIHHSYFKLIYGEAEKTNEGVVRSIKFVFIMILHFGHQVGRKALSESCKCSKELPQH